jgi:hypothetical protein
MAFLPAQEIIPCKPTPLAIIGRIELIPAMRAVVLRVIQIKHTVENLSISERLLSLQLEDESRG